MCFWKGVFGKMYPLYSMRNDLLPEVARRRIENNDRPNAEIVNKSQNNADLVIRSVNFNKSYQEEELFTGKQ